MTPHYPEIWALLQKANHFEKNASADSALDQASACSGIYETFMKRASVYGTDGSPTEDAVGAISFAYALNNTALSLGEKVAAYDNAASALEQLGAVVFLDTTLKQASVNMTGEQLESTQRMQLLGREYGIELLRGLVG